MGCGMSTEEKEGKARNEEIENQLKRDKMLQRNEIKMLLLGAGESGKSTILKQMKLIHEGGYSRDERESFKEIIFSNTVQSMRVILEAMESLELPLDDQRAEYHVQTIFMQPQQIEGDNLPPEVGSAIAALWKDAGVQDCFKRSREYQLNDSARYYFDNIERIAQHDYMPNDQDVLRSRVKTTGITETTFIIGDLTYRMFDVGGQRSERKKWIHCFENVTTILFLVAISEYDQLLFEDETVNRMQEALTLFDSICNSRWFIKTSIILFLNKIDRFKEKLPVSPMKNYFPDYEGGDDYALACDYILNRFVSLNQHETKQIYTHFTCATDTTQIRFVMAAVNDIIIQENLRLDGDGEDIEDIVSAALQTLGSELLVELEKPLLVDGDLSGEVNCTRVKGDFDGLLRETTLFLYAVQERQMRWRWRRGSEVKGGLEWLQQLWASRRGNSQDRSFIEQQIALYRGTGCFKKLNREVLRKDVEVVEYLNDLIDMFG
ncbi:hypothetical protein EYC80_003623 [Monilinia laxa]|uniref:Guanine nucleotide-binding protein subunit alpha n=1 Tax=Monilinia laxa TaxID=61186 RepID=A0A5N6KKI5_MONLA|nr:hypothetical protein EYC80_003623 [Monilinia laxa]